MLPLFIKLKIFLPYQIFIEKANVLSVVAETPKGLFGLLPRRLDCVTILVPGILIYKTEVDEEVYVAVDEGVLVKTGQEILISVRNAIGGTNLAELQETVEREFLALDEREKGIRSVLAKMESGFIRRLAVFHNE